MKLEIFSKDKPKVIHLFSNDIIDILDTLENDYEIKYIDKIILTNTLVIWDSKDVIKLKRNIERLENFTSSKIRVENLSKYFFDLILEGKIGDVFGAIDSLNIQNKFSRIDGYIKNDIRLIHDISSNNTSRCDINKSMIIRYLSDNNFDMNYSNVFDTLRRDIKKTELRKFLPKLFKEIYGYPPEDAIYTSSKDKLNLNSIDDNLIKTLDDEMRDSFGLRRRR